MTEQNGHEIIEIAPSNNPLSRWQPRVRSEFQGLLDNLPKLPPEGKIRLQQESVAILSKCVPPDGQPQRDTGLVVGYVQSGKTMSFTGVAALARDNGYQVVVIITGISRHLFHQSRNRLEQDLRLQNPMGRKWIHFSNPAPTNNIIENISGRLLAWQNPAMPASLRSVILITVMKNRKRLDDLIDVLSRLPLQGVPALVIDDEADQAGLNTLVKKGEASATYSRLLQIRDKLPLHTYLQYTATPQAPLLINLIDILSPRFVDVLIPGQAYVGGMGFFVERPELIRIIPPAEIPTKDHPLHMPPPSLLEAMRVFFIGVAAGHAQGDESSRSMMVHPSEKIIRHNEYFNWVNAIKSRWQKTLAHPEANPDRRTLMGEFKTAYDDLRRTVQNLPSFERVMELLPISIQTTNILQINSRNADKVDWRSTYSHILVGGQAMDRGFTVEGLTVTYMPRGIGVGQADTIQQRARFFGYKRPYLDYCRVFLESRLQDAYRQYIEHEEDVRGRLIRVRDEGKSLVEWKRAFFLTLDLQPTRNNVLGLDYMQDRISDDWFYPASPHHSKDNIELNRRITEQFLQKLSLTSDPGSDQRKPMQRHLVDTNVSVSAAYQDLLTQLLFSSPADSQRYTGVLLQIKAYLEDSPDAKCSVYRISPTETRRREVSAKEEISYLFQGEYPVTQPNRGSIYPGDRAIHPRHGLAIQVHYLNLHVEKKDIATNVPVIAVWIPAEMGRAWLVQDGAAGAAPRS